MRSQNWEFTELKGRLPFNSVNSQIWVLVGPPGWIEDENILSWLLLSDHRYILHVYCINMYFYSRITGHSSSGQQFLWNRNISYSVTFPAHVMVTIVLYYYSIDGMEMFQLYCSEVDCFLDCFSRANYPQGVRRFCADENCPGRIHNCTVHYFCNFILFWVLEGRCGCGSERYWAAVMMVEKNNSVVKVYKKDMLKTREPSHGAQQDRIRLNK